MDYVALLEHVCVCSSHLVEHPQPRLQECPCCGCTLSDEMCDRIGLPHEGANCPDCGDAMFKWPNRDFAELHLEICTDKCCHYPEMHAAGKISEQEYNEWVSTLTPREKLGFYERHPKLRVCVPLTADDMKLQQSPTEFAQLVDSKVKERLNLALKHEHQLRYKTNRKPAMELGAGLNKNSRKK